MIYVTLRSGISSRDELLFAIAANNDELLMMPSVQTTWWQLSYRRLLAQLLLRLSYFYFNFAGKFWFSLVFYFYRTTLCKTSYRPMQQNSLFLSIWIRYGTCNCMQGHRANSCYSRCCIAISLSVCVSVCVCLSVREHICGTAGPIVTKFRLPIPCGRGSVLFWWRCDALCTSGFVDDVTFGRSGPYGDAWLAALRYRGRVWCLCSYQNYGTVFLPASQH